MSENPLNTMLQLDPVMMETIESTNDLVYADGALPAKIKLLMAMAFDAAKGTAPGVRNLAQAAMKAGATKEEVAESIRVAYQLNGIGTVYTASEGLKGLF
ncbi:MAG: carboxymuconolactone decarboxylase family protein [Spirochaetaceae bacterium]|nr:carboxymuconolactone decarboxylase family protein [Spirochaetaceae bacterium]